MLNDVGESALATKNGLIQDATSEKIIAAAEKIALTDGANAVTVRKILNELGVSNRVFYNRFHNLDEVLSAVYTKMVLKIREPLLVPYYENEDFFEYVTDVVTKCLIASYDVKMHFNQYVFETDSLSQINYEWYLEQIGKLFAYAKARGLINDVDANALGYAIWCFCRGYNADAVMRLSKEEAVRQFRYSFRILLEGIKK